MRLQERKGIPGDRNEEEPVKQKKAYKLMQWQPLGGLPPGHLRAGFIVHTGPGAWP